VPVDELTDFARTRRYLPDNLIVTMCGSTGRGEKASSVLSSCGLLNVQVMEGGLKAWQDAGYAVNRRP
jgi:rhodanese-related sulfurtransferase